MFAWMLIPLYEEIDALLDRHGSFNTTQKFRMSVVDYYKRHQNSKQNLDKLLLNIWLQEFNLRRTVQHEEKARERHQSLRLTATAPEKNKVAETQLEFLESFSKKYWQDGRKLYILECSLPAGPLRRAYDAWRSNPKWYLHPELINAARVWEAVVVMNVVAARNECQQLTEVMA